MAAAARAGLGRVEPGAWNCTHTSHGSDSSHSTWPSSGLDRNQHPHATTLAAKKVLQAETKRWKVSCTKEMKYIKGLLWKISKRQLARPALWHRALLNCCLQCWYPTSEGRVTAALLQSSSPLLCQGRQWKRAQVDRVHALGFCWTHTWPMWAPGDEALDGTPALSADHKPTDLSFFLVKNRWFEEKRIETPHVYNMEVRNMTKQRTVGNKRVFLKIPTLYVIQCNNIWKQIIHCKS